MSNPFPALLARTHAWFEQAAAAGWVAPEARARLAAVEAATPADLFAGGGPRPLVIAFFGGTGVGKSSLLNRLAGAALARVAAERPTSREVTLYVHQAVQLAEFPADAPLGEVHVQRHAIAARRDVAWIDMPDIDSTETRNRRIALAWLGHIDLLIYVVSPERYRDDAGWRVLRERAGRHAWIFVMNRWDEGAAGQSDDFTRLLRTAGFEDPILLHTSCAGPGTPGRTLPSPDEFPQIEEQLATLLAHHGARELERLGTRARLSDLRAAVTAALPLLGDDERWARLRETVRGQWRQARDAICSAADWPIAVTAGRVAVREGGFLTQVRGGLSWARAVMGRGEPAAAAGQPAETAEPAAGTRPGAVDLAFLRDALWDDWPQSRVESFLDVAELECRRAGLAAAPPRRLIAERVARAGDDVGRETHQAMRLTLAHPGTVVQRLTRRVTGFLTALLPGIALLWIGYKAILGFHEGGAPGTPYLGSEFAINALLVLGVSWAVPFTLDRLLRPSLEHALRRSLREAFDMAIDQLGNRIGEAIGEAAREAATQRDAARRIVADIAAGMAGAPAGEAADRPLARVVSRGPVTAKV